jgi:hypothetical protein
LINMHQQQWIASALLLLVLAVAAAAAAPEPVNASTNSTSPTAEKLPAYVKVMLAFDGECYQQVASAMVKVSTCNTPPPPCHRISVTVRVTCSGVIRGKTWEC